MATPASPRRAPTGLRSVMAGFTMLEFTNGLSALALFGAAAVSGVHDFVLDNERCAVVNQLLMGLRLSRTAANDNAQTITVCPSSNGRHCSPSGNWSTGWIAFVDRNSDGEMDLNESKGVVAKALNPSARVTVASEWDRFSFAPTHARLSQGSGAAVTLCIRDSRGSDHARVIWLDDRGYAQLHTERPASEVVENATRDFSHRSRDCF